MTLSTRARSLEETPISRNVESTPSRAASHSIVSAVGRVFPRSIWLVFLRETIAGEVGLGQAPRDAELAHAVAQRDAGGCGGSGECGVLGHGS